MVICFIQSKNRKVYLNNQIIYKKGYCNNRFLKLLIKLIIGIFEDYKPYLSKFANGRKLVLPLLMHRFETVSTKAKGESLWPIASP
jgi:hypothetical protein